MTNDEMTNGRAKAISGSSFVIPAFVIRHLIPKSSIVNF
jgi:hypothetical protein